MPPPPRSLPDCQAPALLPVHRPLSGRIHSLARYPQRTKAVLTDCHLGFRRSFLPVHSGAFWGRSRPTGPVRALALGTTPLAPGAACAAGPRALRGNAILGLPEGARPPGRVGRARLELGWRVGERCRASRRPPRCRAARQASRASRHGSGAEQPRRSQDLKGRPKGDWAAHHCPGLTRLLALKTGFESDARGGDRRSRTVRSCLQNGPERTRNGRARRSPTQTFARPRPAASGRDSGWVRAMPHAAACPSSTLPGLEPWLRVRRSDQRLREGGCQTVRPDAPRGRVTQGERELRAQAGGIRAARRDPFRPPRVCQTARASRSSPCVGLCPCGNARRLAIRCGNDRTIVF